MEIEDTSDEDRQEPASRKQYEKKGHPRVSKTKEIGTEVNQEATSNSDKSYTVVIIGDSIIKHLDTRRLKKSVKNRSVKVYAESYRGANTEAVKHHIMPCLARKPNEVILHVGTNDLRDKNSTKIVANINDICNIVKSESPETKITISELVTRTDKTEYKQKVKEVNVRLVDLCNQNNWDLIYHNNIEVRHLNPYGIHLTKQGTAVLAKNFVSYLNNNNQS